MNVVKSQIPLVTMILIAYNQQDFVDKAIDGALAQDYGNLEIILSDDCSEDTTFARMQARAENYSGPHRIRLNCNERNLGIIGHVNCVAEMASGELIVAAAGDDVSLPGRVSETVALWRKHEYKPDLLYFNYDSFGASSDKYIVNRSDELILSQIKNGGSKVFGASAAWTKRIFNVFGPMPLYGLWEDKVLSFRAAILGGICYNDIPVIRYRMERKYPCYGKGLLKQRESMLVKRIGFYQSFIHDLRTLKIVDPSRSDECREFERLIAEQVIKIQRELNLYSDDMNQRVIGLIYLLTGKTWTRWPFRKKLSLFKLVVLDISGKTQ